MDKYLIFRLESWHKVNVANTPDIVKAVYRPPVFEDRKFPCFELVKEFEVKGSGEYQRVKVEEWAEQYSLDNKVRTLVVKGSVFGD